MTHPVRNLNRDDLWCNVYIDEEGRYRWRLLGLGDYEVARASEGYVTQADCLHVVFLVARSGGETNIPIRFEEGIVEINPPT
jgi:uncharacterized protein YegP (UPF0339 family)